MSQRPDASVIECVFQGMRELYPEARWVEVWSGNWWLYPTEEYELPAKSVGSTTHMEFAEIEFLAGIKRGVNNGII